MTETSQPQPPPRRRPVRVARIEKRVERSDGRELSSDPLPCDCCGKLAKKVYHLTDGRRVGSSCASAIETVTAVVARGGVVTDALLYQFRVNKTQQAYLRAEGWL